MNQLKRMVLWFTILTRRQLKKPGLYFLAGILYLFLYLFDCLVLPGNHSLSYGILSDGAECGEAVIRFLSEDTLYRTVRVKDRSSLEQEVASGRLDCGFVLTEKLNEAEGPQIPMEAVEYVCSTSTARGAVLKEKVYAAVLRETTRSLLRSVAASGKLSISGDPASFSEDMLFTYEEYLAGDDTIHVIYETVEVQADPGAREAELPGNLSRFLAVCRILIFVSAVVFGRTRFSTDYQRIGASLVPQKERLWRFLSVFSPVLLLTSALLPAVLIRIIPAQLPVYTVSGIAVSLILLSVLCSLWSFVYASLFRKESYYISSIPVLLGLCIVTNPVFTQGIHLGTVLETVRYLFPPAWL